MTPRIPAAASDFASARASALVSAGGDPLWARPGSSAKAAVIAGLRSRILGLERHAPSRGPSASPEESSLPEDGRALRAPRRLRWELGCPSFDELLPRGLETNSVHEIKGVASAPGGASAGNWMAAIGFAARLAVRRVEALSAARARAAPLSVTQPWVLWCWPRALVGEFGAPSAAGFAHLGLDPSRLLIVETGRAGEALGALEESLKASSLALVIGVLDEIELTPARRLSLAAAETATPCLLVTHPASEPAGATATRWRVGRAASADHQFDPRAPGSSRFSAILERCRARPESASQPPLILEWSDETRRFGLASVVADLPAQTCGAQSGAFAAAVRTC